MHNRMEVSRWQIAALFLIQCLHLSHQTLSHMDNLYTTIFNSYNRKTLPLLNHNSTVNVNISFLIVSLNNFDELSGELSMTMLFQFTWLEERLSWNPADYGGITSLLVATEDIWRPQIYLIQSANKVQEITNISTHVRLNYNGYISWMPAEILIVICSVDVTYFPFDKQTCDMNFQGWMYLSSEMKLTAASNDLNTVYYTKNNQWELLPSDVTAYTADPSTPSSATVSLRLQRRDTFFVVYLIIPIVLLGCINNLVFAMPASTGERTSVAITTFLSFVVYMEIVNDNVPASSSPMSYMYFYLLFLLVYSSVILFLCILSLRIYNKDGDVPYFVRVIIQHLRFSCLKNRPTASSRVSPVDDSEPKAALGHTEDIGDANAILAHEWIVSDSDAGKRDDVTWVTVGKTFDVYCITILYIVFGLFSLITFVQLYSKKGL